MDEEEMIEKATKESWRENRFHAMVHFTTIILKDEAFNGTEGDAIAKANAMVNTIERLS